ncbi:hypothetical protein J7L05_08625 [bacterium]|nr:hypothetical protein [bacterium]
MKLNAKIPYLFLLLFYLLFIPITLSAQENCPPDPCDGAYCQSGLFECTWIGTETITIIPYIIELPPVPAGFDVTCEPTANHPTCIFWMAHCEALKGCCATPTCEGIFCPRFPEKSITELGFRGYNATPAIRNRIAGKGCCFGPYHEIEFCNANVTYSTLDFPGEPDFCVSCCDKVTTEFMAYGPAHFFSTSATVLNDSCASIAECFYTFDPVTGEQISCPSGVGILEMEEEYCCGCPTT